MKNAKNLLIYKCKFKKTLNWVSKILSNYYTETEVNIMMKKEKAFSLAELLISLLVTSMILSATVPTITRRASSINENPFSYFNGANVKGVSGNSQQLWLGVGGG